MRFLIIINLLFLFPFMQARSFSGFGEEKKAGDLDLSIKSISFFKNNEYSNPLIEGYTLTGYFLQPEIVYLPSEKVELRLGAHLLGYSGTNKYSLVKPVFSVSYSFSEKALFTIGTLKGSDSHVLLDPHFNKERLYNRYSEEGLQLTFDNDRFFSDAWISWENYIFRGGNDREIFTAGESFRYTSSLLGGWFRFEIPVQLQVKHFGGQISNYPEPVETYINSAAGVRFTGDIKNRRPGRAGFDYLIFNGGELTGKAVTGIRYGYAEWFRLFYESGRKGVVLGYWLSNDYYAPDGNFIFGSVSDYRRNTTISGRRILTISGSITFLPESFLEIYLGFDGYYDTRLKRFDHSLALHVRLDKLVKLASVKR